MPRILRLLATVVMPSAILACGPDTITPTPLAISSVAPNSAPSGSEVSIYGAGFSSAVTVTMGGVRAEVVRVSPGSILARTPELPAGVLDIVVTNTDGESATLPKAFTLVEFLLREAFPARGFGNAIFHIFGSGFVRGMRPHFNGVPSPSFRVIEDQNPLGLGAFIMGVLPAHGPGTVDVRVTHPSGASRTLPGAFTYVSAPVLTASPETVPVGGSLTLSWVADGSRGGDYIGVYRDGARYFEPPYDLLLSIGGTSGTLTLSAPQQPGRYEFAYLPWYDEWNVVCARSNVLTVTPASPAEAYGLAAIWQRPFANGAASPPQPKRY